MKGNSKNINFNLVAEICSRLKFLCVLNQQLADVINIFCAVSNISSHTVKNSSSSQSIFLSIFCGIAHPLPGQRHRFISALFLPQCRPIVTFGGRTIYHPSDALSSDMSAGEGEDPPRVTS